MTKLIASSKKIRVLFVVKKTGATSLIPHFGAASDRMKLLQDGIARKNKIVTVPGILRWITIAAIGKPKKKSGLSTKLRES
jgi:hypothetical protein